MQTLILYNNTRPCYKVPQLRMQTLILCNNTRPCYEYENPYFKFAWVGASVIELTEENGTIYPKRMVQSNPSHVAKSRTRDRRHEWPWHWPLPMPNPRSCRGVLFVIICLVLSEPQLWAMPQNYGGIRADNMKPDGLRLSCFWMFLITKST